MKKETILYLRTDIYNKKIIAGGSISHTIGVIQGFLDAGWNVICVSSVMIDHLKNLNLLHFKELKNPKTIHCLRWKLNCLFSNIFFSYQILRLLKQHSPDYIYQRYSILNCVGFIISRIKKIPLILEFNSSEVWLEKNWAKRKWWFTLTWIIRFIERINIHNAYYIVVVSEPLKEQLIQFGVDPNKVLVNPNGVNTDFFNPDILQNDASFIRKNLNIQDKFVFGFIGSFSIWHGIDVLAQVVPQIIQIQSKVHFLFIGDGPLLDFLKQELNTINISQHITFIGPIEQKEARKYLAACDAFLSPTNPNKDGSRFFGSPTKIFEYLSMARPIIASELDQIAEVIYPAFKIKNINEKIQVSNEVGIVVQPKDVQGFVNAACFLINLSKDDLNKMGFNARNKAIKNYRWQDHVKKIGFFVHK